MVAFWFPVLKVAAFPAMVIIFGLGGASKVALGFAEAVFPIAVAAAGAASQAPTALVWSAQAMSASPAVVLARVVLPAATPGLLTGARVGLVGAFVGVFIGEMTVSSDGLGHLMVEGWRRLETDTLYLAVLAVSVLGFVLDRALLLARRRLLRWSDEHAP